MSPRTAYYHLIDRLRHQRARFVLDAVQQFQLALLLLLALILVGTMGYMALEGMTFHEALYMTAITLSTVGFGEIRPLSVEGRYFTMIILVTGLGVTAYAVRNAVEIALGNRLWLTMGERDVERQIATISGHYIICGYGRMGREIASEFRRRREPFVVIDQNEKWRTPFLEDHTLFVIGDATHDDALLAAGIERARGLLAVVNSDANNVLIVLSAKGLNPAIKVIARAATAEIESKLRRAGADHVTSPYVIGAQRMAAAMIRPAVYTFSKQVIFGLDPQNEMGQITIREGSPLIGQTLRTSNLRDRWGAIVIAILDEQGQMTIGPEATHRIRTGETLVIVAPIETLNALEHGEAG